MNISRRDFIKKVFLAGIAFSSTAFALPKNSYPLNLDRDYILIGHPNPSTGQIASFGEGTPWVDERAVSFINNMGGIYIKEYGKKLPVKVKVVDTESDPVKAANAATSLILQDKIDLMLALHTPDTTNPVSAVCERYKIPCICLDTPIESWLSDGPYKWCYHAFWSIESLAEIQMAMWDKFSGRTAKIVGGLWPDDPDGISWAKVFKNRLNGTAYQVVDAGRFPVDTKDYTGIITLLKQQGVEIVTGVLTQPAWTTLWRQSHLMGFGPKIATISKGAIFPSSIEGLGRDLEDGITCEVWWSPDHPFKSSFTGETCKAFSDAWTNASGRPWTQVLGFKHAGFEIALDALQRAQTLNKEGLRKAIAETDLDTIVGHIRYNDEHYAETPLVLGQWIRNEKDLWELKIIFNDIYPRIPKNGDMVFPLGRRPKLKD